MRTLQPFPYVFPFTLGGTLTALIAEQAEMNVDPLLRFLFTSGATEYDYDISYVLYAQHSENPSSHKATILLQNSDGEFTSKDLRSYHVAPRWGLVTPSGNEYSTTAPLWVRDQQLLSLRGRMVCQLLCIGIPDRLQEDKASDDYSHHWSSTKTVLDLATEILDGTAVSETLTESQETVDSYFKLGLYDVGTTDLAGAVKTEAAKGATSVALKSLGTGTINIDTVLNIDGHATDYIVTANATISGNEATVSISPALTDVAEVDDLINLNWRWGSGQTGTMHAFGQRLPVIDRTVTKISFVLKKTGSPTGDVSFKVYDVDGSAVLATKVLADASTLTTSPVWYEVTLTTPLSLDSDITKDADGNYVGGYLFYVEYVDGDSSNYVQVRYSSIAVKSNQWQVQYSSTQSPGDARTENHNADCAYRYKYTGAGISVYSHCASWEIVDDTASGDSLLDSYCPADAFFIRFGESRLNVIDRLLGYTKTERMFKTDGKIHLVVPTTTGTGYVSEYALTTGQTFFSKSTREALVIPNRIVVESLPDDATQYSGEYTSAASYALMPITEFIRTKLTSNAQGIAIATARISHLEVASQRGSASVSMNCCSELWDYVKVTDERQSDSRTGNIGYLTRTFNPMARSGSDKYRLDFGFGGVSVKGVPGTQLSALKSRLTEAEIERASPVTWSFILDDVIPTLDKMAESIHNIEIGLEYYNLLTPTDEQIDTALIPFLRDVVEDTTPQLGGNLDVNGNKIIGLLTALTEKTLERAVSTTYTNSTSYPIFVAVIMALSSDADGGALKVHASADPPTLDISNTQTGAAGGSAGTLVGIVPVGWKYRVDVAGGATMFAWIETGIG